MKCWTCGDVGTELGNERANAENITAYQQGD